MATKYVVTDEQYRKIDRKMLEIKRQLNQKNGSPLYPDSVLCVLQQIVDGFVSVSDLDLGEVPCGYCCRTAGRTDYGEGYGGRCNSCGGM